MTSWGATQAKAKFSEVLDKADEAPQRIERRKKRYILLTEEQYVTHGAAKVVAEKPFVSAWEALAPSFSERYDVDFPRIRGKMREVDLG